MVPAQMHNTKYRGACLSAQLMHYLVRETPMHPATTLDHVGIAVTDLGAALATYTGLLGLSAGPREALADRGIEVAFLGEGPVRLELLAPMAGDSEIATFLQRRGEGVHHICLRVTDLPSAVAALEAKGARLVSGGIRPGAHGTRVAFVHPKTAHGVLVELVEATSAPAPPPT
jgi:methylmalonyl-CoA/ethylmalonyl-CoA epimerase